MNDKPKELEEHSAKIFEFGCIERPVYLKEDVDAVIAGLKQKLQDQCISCPVKMQEDDVVAELKQKLEDSKATAYAESVDAGMRERRLKRALWIARADKARFLAMVIDNYPYTQVLHFTSRKKDESGKPLGVARTSMEWWRMFREVERKCRAKAEQYQ